MPPAESLIGPYETQEQASVDAREVYELARSAYLQVGVMTEANHGRLLDTCKDAGVYLGSYDHRILRWLAGYEPETVQVLIGIISRAHLTAGER